MTQFKNVITLFPGEVRLDQLRRVLRECAPVEIDARAFPAVERSHAVVDDVIARGAVVYGINTGFGKMAQTVIPSDKLAELQKNLVLSHSVGTGAPLADSTVHLIMTLKAISLARGHSGVRPEAIHALVRLINAGVYPCIPAKGSVGASGDLAPLAHMTSLLIGVGHARVDGERVTALEGLRHAGLEPLQLGPKEGLAFLNGTQVSTALALVGLFAAEDVFASAVLAGALSLEAIKGSLAPFDSRIHAARGQPGQIDVAAAYRALLEDSPIVSSHHDCGRVQDPYSIRCQPQVMGACLDRSRRHCDCHRRNRCNIRTSSRLAARFESVGPAAFPRHRRWPALGVHDCAGNGRSACVGKQVARPSGQRRQSADLRQSGGSRVNGDLRRTAPGRHGGKHRRCGRHRSDGSSARCRVSSPAAFNSDTRTCDQEHSRERGLL
jgi:histidine ammonia-lyase